MYKNYVLIFLSVNISKCRASSSSHCISDNRHVRLCAVYSILILQHIGMGIVMIVNVVASRAFHSLQKSSQVDDEDNPCPIFVNISKIAIHPQPISRRRNIKKYLPHFSFFLHEATYKKKIKILDGFYLKCTRK